MGYHIRTLVLKLFLMYLPQVIEAGILCAAIPPLYSIKGKGGKNVYFTSRMDFAKYVQSVFNKSHTIASMAGKKLTPSEAIKIFYQNADYAYDMNILARTFAVHPLVLEQVLFQLADTISFEKEVSAAGFAQAAVAKNAGVEAPVIKDYLDRSILQAVSYSLDSLDYAKFKRAIEKKFRFIKVSKVNNTIVISGEFEEKSNQIFLNSYFVSSCIDMINAIRRIKERNYKLDGNPVTIYTIMNTFDSIMPDVKRYKGLGEMNSNEAAESTTLPDNRTLIQYTLESAKEEIESIRFIDNNVSSILSTIHIRRQDVE